MAENNYVIAADIGGSHITAAGIDLNNKTIDGETLVRVAVSNNAETTEVISAWADCLKSTNVISKASHICLAMPGPFDYGQGICYIRDQAKYPGLYGANVKTLLAEKLDWPVEKIFMENDAACFIEGEVFCGSMEGFDSVVGITLGTGLGSAVYKNGNGRDAALWDSPFKNGIAEDYISSRWFVKKYGELTGRDIGGVKQLIESESDKDLVRMIFDEFSENLASFLHNFSKSEKSQAIVLGGNISKAFEYFSDKLINELENSSPGIIVKPSKYGEHAALLGAASAWRSSLQ